MCSVMQNQFSLNFFADRFEYVACVDTNCFFVINVLVYRGTPSLFRILLNCLVLCLELILILTKKF